MKLTIEHLAPYLPYGLRINDGSMTYELTGAFLDEWFNWGELRSDVKPILRPLSDLAKIIDGKLFNYLDYIATSIKDSQKNARLLLDGKFDQLEYWKIQRLFQYHFDVFGLIEQGLAIDTNTLNNKK